MWLAKIYRQKCLCSADTKNRRYLGIRRCNHTSNEASLTHGYWAGCTKNMNCTKYAIINFRTSSCPKGYCSHKANNEYDVSLPLTHSELSGQICSENRYGVICALCKNGTSVHSHTQSTFPCIEEIRCKLGILFFILSQIIPVTILFNGFLFYAQIFDTLSLNADNFIAFHNTTRKH